MPRRKWMRFAARRVLYALGMHFRRAEDADIERLIEIHASAFPDPRLAGARRTNFMFNSFGDLDDLHVGELEGVVVAHAFLFPLALGFGGRRVRAGGIATVGVAPEARGTGVATGLLDHLHAQSRLRGDAITVLYAFRQSFYARHGYAPASASKRLYFSPRAVPAAWRESGKVRAATGEDSGAIIACYERAVSRGTGLIVRPQRFWESRLCQEKRRWFVALSASSEVTGYLVWTASQSEAHAKTTLVVHDLVADDDVTKRVLYGLIGAQRDQIAEVEIDVDDRDPIDRMLEDPDQLRFGTETVEHVIGEIVGGPMVRIDDPARALVARGYLADGAIDLAIDGGEARRLEIQGGVGRVAAPGAGPVLRLHGNALAQTLYGALAPSDAAHLGLASADDASTLALADSLLALPPYFALDPF